MPLHQTLLRLALLAGAAILAGCANQSSDFAGPLHAFSTCDRSFFTALKSNEPALSPYLDLTEDVGIAYPSFTGDPLASKVTTFKQPATVNGVQLLAYQSAILTNAYSKPEVFWGFIAKGTPDAVYTALSPLLSSNHKMLRYKDGLMWTEARTSDDPPGQWPRPGTPLGTATIPGTIEHSMMLFANDDPNYPNSTKIECTIQGDVTADLVQTYRPDITSELRRRARQS